MEKPRSARDFPGITRVLRFFVESRRYSVVDRIGFAQSDTAVKEAIYEALRTIKVLRSRAARVELKAGDKTYTLRCLDYSDKERDIKACGGITGIVSKVLDGPQELQGKTICCYPDPGDVGEDELIRFFEALSQGDQGLSLAKELAALAFTYRRKAQDDGQ